MVFIAGKLCDLCLSTLKWFVYHARHYTSAWLYLRWHAYLSLFSVVTIVKKLIVKNFPD